jgi:hypothetical protein
LKMVKKVCAGNIEILWSKLLGVKQMFKAK